MTAPGPLGALDFPLLLFCPSDSNIVSGDVRIRPVRALTGPLGVADESKSPVGRNRKPV
jgi:hypothetical protein